MGGGALRRRGSAPRVRRTRAWSLRGTARHARLYGRCAPAAGLPTRDVARAPPTAAACVARPFRRSHATFVRAGRAWSPQASPSLPPRPSRALAQPEKKADGRAARVYKVARWPAPPGSIRVVARWGFSWVSLRFNARTPSPPAPSVARGGGAGGAWGRPTHPARLEFLASSGPAPGTHPRREARLATARLCGLSPWWIDPP